MVQSFFNDMKIADFCKKNSDVIIGGAILLGIYLLETAIRPLTAPGEFRNIALLRTLLGELPVHKLYFRLPAVAATFIGAIAGSRKYSLCINC